MGTRVMSRCECGRVKSKWTDKCKACSQARLDKCHAEAQAIVITGRCPKCSDKLERNLALSGWWQCANYGNRRLRNGRADNPDCSFQTFTGE